MHYTSCVCTGLNHRPTHRATLLLLPQHTKQHTTNQQAFRSALDENGAEFPQALSDKLWNLIKAMKVIYGWVGRGRCGDVIEVDPTQASQWCVYV